jgi:glycerol-3-phosphate acyltransferase PlsX
VKIALDAMGGDLAPQAAIDGAVRAARDFAAEVILVGDRETIERELAEHGHAGLAISIEHAAEVVAMDEAPLESVIGKPESSIHVGLELVKQGRADAFVSAGNSGAVMAAAMAILGNLPGVDRPAIASAVPTTAGLALLIDAGANTDVKAVNLTQFGVMGSVYWKHIGKLAQPRVAILANGEEDSKGTDLTRSAAAALAQLAPQINYVGYVEGRDINRAKADVIVTDGFTGNVTLKTMEGFASFLLGNLREVFESGLWPKIAYLLIRKRLGAIRTAANEALVRNVNGEIVEILSHLPTTVTVKASGSKGIRGLLHKMRDRLHLPHREGHPERKEGRAETDALAAHPVERPEGGSDKAAGGLRKPPLDHPLSTNGTAAEPSKPGEAGGVAVDHEKAAKPPIA